MKKFIPIILAILLILPIMSCAEKDTGPKAEKVTNLEVPEFSVSVNGINITQEDLAEYNIYSVVAKSVNSSGTESEVTYVGYAIKDILKAAGLTEKYVWLEATAGDGYTVTITGDVVLKDTTLLAMTKDGSPFSSSPWLAPCNETVSGNYLKGTESIIVTTSVPE